MMWLDRFQRWGWLSLLVAAVCMTLPVAAEENAAGPTPAQVFDARFKAIDSIEFTIDGPEHSKALLAELKGLLPPGDAHRERLYQSMVCTLGFDERHDEGLAFAKAGTVAAEKADDAIAMTRFYLCLASYTEANAPPSEVLPIYAQAIEAARRSGDPDLIGYSVAFRGAVYSIQGEQALALLDFLEAQRLFESAGMTADAENNLFNIAVAYRRMGEFAKAADYLAQREAVAVKKDDKATLIGVYSQIGFLHEEQGKFDAAEAAFKKALELARKTDSRTSLGSSRLALAGVYVQTGRHRLALTTLERAKKDFETGVSDTSNAAMIQLYSGKAKAGLGQHREALKDFDAADTALTRLENLRYLALLYDARSRSHEAVKDYAAATSDLKRLLEVRQALTEKVRSQQTLLLQHQFDTTRRDLENAQLSAEKALREQEVASLIKARRWQWAAIVLAAAMLVLLSVLAVRQVLRLRRLQVLALTDTLTGAANRRRIERFANEQITDALANNRKFTILTLDVDYFKRINDTYGHMVGDQVLVRVCNACQAGLREFDVLGRTGGEEFLVVLPRTLGPQGTQVAERLRANVAAMDLSDIAPGLSASISLGVAEFKNEDRELKELMRRADNALYRAKAEGRNRVEIEP